MTMEETSTARRSRKEYLSNKIHELYSAGKKPEYIAKKLGIEETRVIYYLSNNRK